MDSFILNQSLEIYGQYGVAVCRLPTSTSEALSFLKKGWSDVVVLDQNEQPQGLFNAKCLLNCYSDTEPLSFVTPATALGDIDLEPLPTIASTMSITNFLQRISQYRHSAEMWALVNGDGRFMGILEVSSLLRSIVAADQGTSSMMSFLLPLINQLPLPAMLSDKSGAIVGMNDAWQRSFHDVSVRSHEDSPEHYQFCITDGEAMTWQVMNVSLQGFLEGLELAIAYNITAQKNLAQELSGVSRLKDEFLTCINHELKTPLTSVIGIASLLSNNTFGELNDRQSRYVKMIHQSGRQLVSIIDNIFDLAKAESGQLELYAETISVRDVCQKSIQQVKKLVQQDSAIFRNYNFEDGWELDIQLDIDPSVQTISADETRLQQMLVNLLSNAFKFSVLPSGMVDDSPHTAPQIGITVRWWEGWLALTVWDQGIGIPEEKQSLVFQKFQQVENVMTRRFEGTGSSLLLTRHLARLHGGDITFVSQVDVGSQFTILLPPEFDSSNIDDARIRRLNDPTPAHLNRLVLVVETSAETVERLQVLLGSLEYQVVVARSGTEALEKARRLQPCLILLSPDLPMLSGWDVLALLKGDAMTQHIRVVIMNRADEPRSISQIADGILTKPVKESELNMFLSYYSVAPKSVKFLYLNHDLDESVIGLFQDLGYCLIEADDLPQCDVLSKIWQPRLFLLGGDSQLLLDNLEQIAQMDAPASLPILLITRSAIAELDWLQRRFANLKLYDCNLLNLDDLNMKADTLMFLHQAITNAMCVTPPDSPLSQII